MPDAPYIKILESVTDQPILTALDISKGMWRSTYEGMLMGKPTKTAIGHGVSQIVSSAVGRLIDNNDETITGIDSLKGQSMIVRGVTSSLVAGGIDSVMRRGTKTNRFVAPVAIDAAVELAASTLYNGNPRIL